MLFVLVVLAMTVPFLALGAGMVLVGLHLARGRDRSVAMRSVGVTMSMMGASGAVFGAYFMYQVLFTAN